MGRKSVKVTAKEGFEPNKADSILLNQFGEKIE